MHLHVTDTRPATTARGRRRRRLSLALTVLLAGGVALTVPATAQAAPDGRGALSVRKTVSAATARPGDHLTWTVQVTCESITAMCQDVTLDDTVPSPFVLDDNGVSVQGQQTGQATTTVSGSSVTVAFAETDPNHPGATGLAAGQSVSVLLSTTLPAGTGLGWDGRTVTNTAQARATNADQAADSADASIVVPVTPSVAVTKSFTPSDQVAGQSGQVALHLTTTNTSPVDGTAITLTEPAAASPASFGPGTPLELTGIGGWTLPQGATAMSLDLATADGTTTIGPYAAGATVDTGALDLATVTAVTARYTGTITAGGSAGALDLQLRQNGTAPRDAVTKVPDTVAAHLATSRGAADATANATFQINPVTVEVSAGKLINGVAHAQVVAGADATVALTATNSSNTSLGSLSIAEPSGSSTSPFGDPAAGKLGFVGFGTDGSGTLPASTWPSGATSAVVTLTGTGTGLPQQTTVVAPSGGTVTWPTVPAGAVVTGFTVAYTGSVAALASAQVPFLVRTDAAWTSTTLFPNEVAVDGAASDGTVADTRTASADLTVLPRRVVTTTTKTLTGTVGATPVTGATGQQLIARLTGRISADTTVPVGQLVVEDLAGPGSTLWSIAALDRIGSVQVPSGSQAQVLLHTTTGWATLAGPTSDASTLLDLTVPAGVDGVRVVYTGTPLPIDGTFTPVTALVFALTSDQTPGTSATDTATSTATGTGDGAGLTGQSQGDAAVTFGPGSTPISLERADASKSWQTPAALIPLDNADPGASDRPTNRLTLRVQNITGVPVHTLRIVDPAPGSTSDAFDRVDVTHLSVTAPTGTTGLLVVLRDSTGATLMTLTSAGAVAALSAADLADVAGLSATATGTLPDNAALVVQADTVLRAATRTDGTPVVGTEDGPPSTTLTNTVRGDLGDGTASDDAQASTVLYPQARQPLTGAAVKSLTPATGTRYASNARTVRLALSAHRTSDAAVSRPSQYVLEDTTPAFWDEFDLVGLTALSGVTAADGPGYTAAVQYLVDGAWSTPVTSVLAAGTPTSSPALPAGAGALPSGVTGDRVTGIRVTFTAPDGAWFANRTVGGFEGPTALVSLSPRSTLRSSATLVPTGAVTNVVTGTVTAQSLSSPVTLTPASATYTVTDGTPDATLTKTPASTTTGPGSRLVFTLTATSSGSAPVSDPVLTDVLPTDGDGAQLVYDPDVWGAATVTVTPTGADLGTPTVELVGTQLRVTFPAGTRLMPGQQVQVSVPLAVRAGVVAGTTLVNTARFTGSGLVRVATAQVAVISLPTYLRVKDVREDVADGATASGAVNSVTGQACTSADGFFRTPCLVRTQPGGTETWRLRLTNTGNLPTASATLVDVLPYAGDTGISRSQSTSSRGSVWATRYVGDLQVSGVPTGASSTVSYLVGAATCSYTGDPRSADPFGSGCPASAWTPADQVDDLAQVRGVRVDLDLSGARLEPGQTVTVTFRTRSTTSYDLAAADVDAPAWNTMAVTTASVGGTGLVYETLEPNRAGVAVDRTFALGDRVWQDFDLDGVQDGGEPGLGGVRVELYPAGSDTLLAATTTDADGHYLFDLLPAGDYRVRFVPDEATASRLMFTVTGQGEASTDSDADRSTGWSGTVHLGSDSGRVRAVVAADGSAADYVDPTVDAGLAPHTDVALTLTKKAVDRSASTVTWLLTATSVGLHDTWAGITVTDPLPQGLRFVSATGDGFTCTAEDGLLTCAHPDRLTAGASATVTVVTALVDPRSTVSNTATVQADRPHGVIQVLADSASATSAPSRGSLASTGAAGLGWLLAAAALALAAGTGLLLLVRSRRTR